MPSFSWHSPRFGGLALAAIVNPHWQYQYLALATGTVSGDSLMTRFRHQFARSQHVWNWRNSEIIVHNSFTFPSCSVYQWSLQSLLRLLSRNLYIHYFITTLMLLPPLNPSTGLCCSLVHFHLSQLHVLFTVRILLHVISLFLVGNNSVVCIQLFATKMLAVCRMSFIAKIFCCQIRPS